ncbi:unnamed protein product [Vitrella brassicaformis CCMP3155]|uniref:H15 domain-containing protein n=1 Tax=Vitrella brassicaformis (strain CCMP3155) TaxID=1169540 RepID=A0A0G4EU04_VITBC|nr:unnamed protein product [Vitrella brassicaformis CCMP3155]|eukprot:CEM01548.1 unnamed protein product [Vitrella brassicaformis CCMP3155]
MNSCLVLRPPAPPDVEMAEAEGEAAEPLAPQPQPTAPTTAPPAVAVHEPTAAAAVAPPAGDEEMAAPSPPSRPPAAQDEDKDQEMAPAPPRDEEHPPPPLAPPGPPPLLELSLEVPEAPEAPPAAEQAEQEAAGPGEEGAEGGMGEAAAATGRPRRKAAQKRSAAAGVHEDKAKGKPTGNGKAKCGGGKARAASKHSSYEEMIKEAIGTLKDRSGSSLFAIKKFIQANYSLDFEDGRTKGHLSRSLKKMAEAKKLIKLRTYTHIHRIHRGRIKAPLSAKKSKAAPAHIHTRHGQQAGRQPHAHQQGHRHRHNTATATCTGRCCSSCHSGHVSTIRTATAAALAIL